MRSASCPPRLMPADRRRGAPERRRHFPCTARATPYPRESHERPHTDSRDRFRPARRPRLPAARRRFAAAAASAAAPHYDALYRRSVDDPEAFWGEMAASSCAGCTPWDQVLDWQPPFAKWFVGGKLNVSDNCLDRHLDGPRRNKAAIIWEGEPGDDARRSPTRSSTARSAGSPTCCKRPRRQGGRPRRHLHADGPGGGRRHARLRAHRRHPQRGLRRLLRRGAARPHQRRAGAASSSPPTAAVAAAAIVPLKANVDEALAETPVGRATSSSCGAPASRCTMQAGRDHWWHELMDAASADCPRRAARQRAPALHPLHLRHDRQAEGRRAHHRRLPPARAR